MATYEARVLRAAITAARKALRDLDEEQIPASLRPVAASAARKLPPPLATALIRDLDRFEWLREKAADAWPDINEATGDDAASAAFLLRAEGWEQVVDDAVSDRSEQDVAALAGQLTKQVHDLEYRLGVERERVDKAKAETAEAEKRARRQSAEIAGKVDEATRAERVSRIAAESRAKELQRRLETVQGDLLEADDRVAFLKEELLRAKRSAAAQASQSTLDVWSSRTPAELASLLDQIAASATPHAVPEDEVPRAEPVGLVFPAGVRPDDAGAVDWLLSQGEPFVMIVDGYNLSHQWTPAITREDLNHRLARLRRLATAPVRLLVVYDSKLTGGGQDGPGPGGIDIRFTDEDAIADEEIIELARITEGNVVVVSSDREVREGSPTAMCLWSQAVRDWFRR